VLDNNIFLNYINKTAALQPFLFYSIFAIMIRFSICYFILVLLFIFIIQGCKNDKQISSIHLTVVAPAEGKVYLTKVGFIDEKDKIVDSSKELLIYNYSFSVKKDSSSLYYLRLPYFSKKVYLIADADNINVEVNLAKKSFTVSGSVSSNIFYDFIKAIKSVNNNPSTEQIAIIHGQNNADKIFTLPFIDTVSNPAVFLTAYNTIEFGNDYKLLKEVVDKASTRFPAVNYIQLLKNDAYRMIDIFEKEFNVNDSLPSFSLRDNDSILFSTASLKGKYYLINFWSTWCESCYYFMESMKKSYPAIDSSKFVFVSAAIDDNKNSWKKILNQQHYSWTNLIDEKMWKGPAVNTLKFDSIPFSFLVSPKGIVLAKAITPDSLQIVLRKYNLIK